MTRSFVSLLRDRYNRWRARQRKSEPNKDAAISYLMTTHEATYQQNQDQINRQWTAMLIIGGHARKLPAAPSLGRQLCFEFGAEPMYCHVPESIQVGDSEFRLLDGGQEDWTECLNAIDRYGLMLHRLFDGVLRPIFAEHPGITGSAAIEIAIERKTLREWRDDDDAEEARAV
jgi:hypothetical protein